MEAGRSVGHAGGGSLFHEMLGKEEPAAMMLVDFRHEGRPVRCGSRSGPVPEVGSSYVIEIAARRHGPARTAVYAAWLGAPKWEK